ncbi:MAG: hypothetical protein GX225_02225 [Clostridiales bacterium]|nr:hypothetical protein [Clostridiales bacterium]
MTQVANEILKGKNLDLNLTKYGLEMMNIYNAYSKVRLAMNYYTCYEMVSNKLNTKDTLSDIVTKISDIIHRGVLNTVTGDDYKDILAETESLRNQVIDIMKGLTSDADIFNLYEYILNRMEYRFKDSSHIMNEDKNALPQSLISYILSDKDNVVMNTRICEIIRELPLRMTKSKFFELLHSGLEVYKDSPKKGLDDFLYMLRTVSTIDIDKNAFILSKDIENIFNDFKNANYSDLTEEKYDELHNKLEFVVGFIQANVNDYLMIAELINDVYVIILSSHYVEEQPLEHNSTEKIIATIYEKIQSKDALEEEIELEEYFIALEGLQEKYYRQFSTNEHVLEMILENYSLEVKILMLEEQFNSLKIISLLESGSTFIEFNNIRDESMADKAYVDEKFDELKADMEKMFKENNKLVNRAIMSHVLASLPIFFNNIDEIKTYIEDSISSCGDDAEITACTEIFHSLMEE